MGRHTDKTGEKKSVHKRHKIENQEAKAKFYIFSGILKGMRLEWAQKASTRPTKAIVRESFFNTIGCNIIGSIFIEAFGGCGSMGIEAISRGADKAIFYEYDKETYEILLQNIENAKKKMSTLKLYAHNADFLAQSIQDYMDLKRHIILYLDPPFSIRDGMEDIYEKLFIMVKNFHQSNVDFIIFEYWSGYNMPSILGDYTLLKIRRFGKSSLAYYVQELHTKD